MVALSPDLNCPISVSALSSCNMLNTLVSHSSWLHVRSSTALTDYKPSFSAVVQTAVRAIYNIKLLMSHISSCKVPVDCWSGLCQESGVLLVTVLMVANLHGHTGFIFNVQKNFSVFLHLCSSQQQIFNEWRLLHNVFFCIYKICTHTVHRLIAIVLCGSVCVREIFFFYTPAEKVCASIRWLSLSDAVMSFAMFLSLLALFFIFLQNPSVLFFCFLFSSIKHL